MSEQDTTTDSWSAAQHDDGERTAEWQHTGRAEDGRTADGSIVGGRTAGSLTVGVRRSLLH